MTWTGVRTKVYSSSLYALFPGFLATVVCDEVATQKLVSLLLGRQTSVLTCLGVRA